jgi:perosamine synthetase
VGSIADLTAFSLHPVKHITTGEGGIVTTDDPEAAARMRMFRNHGITADHRAREAQGSWFYEIADLGYNYRLTDFQCALGISQLTRLPRWIARRREIAGRYDDAFADLSAMNSLSVREGVYHAYHLYVIRLDLALLRVGRAELFSALRAAGIGVNVHYIPVHLHPYYRARFGTTPGLCPNAEAAYERILSLPLYHGMSDRDVGEVIAVVRKVVRASRK